MKEKDYSAHPLKTFFSYYGPHKKMFFIDMLCSALVAIIDLAFPYVSKMSMQRLLPEHLFRTFFIVMAIIVAA